MYHKLRFGRLTTMTVSNRSWCVWRVISEALCLLLLVSNHGANATCFPAIFNFGDSSSDTGGNHAAFPTETAAEYLPYGQTYFGVPQSRYSDGRLTIDFITEVYGMRYLDPYLQSVTSDFSTGVNFAIAWSTARQVLDYKTVFPLGTQISQFQLFKKGVTDILNSTSALLAKRGLQTNVTLTSTSSTTGVGTTAQNPYKILYDQLFRRQDASVRGAVDTTATEDPELKDSLEAARRLPLAEYFSGGLYIIWTGTSDFSAAIEKQQTLLEIQAFLPDMVTAISDAVKAIYDEGGRNIIVGGVGPIGCLPVQLTSAMNDPKDLDNFGCLESWNSLVRSYNVLLKQGLADLRVQFPLANIVYLDIYQIQHNIIFNGTQNGLSGGLKSCCGVPSTYNFNPKISCGETGIVDGGLFLASETCTNAANYTIWDGYHYTEAANHHFAKQILSGRYFDPSFSLVAANCTSKAI